MANLLQSPPKRGHTSALARSNNATSAATFPAPAPDFRPAPAPDTPPAPAPAPDTPPSPPCIACIVTPTVLIIFAVACFYFYKRHKSRRGARGGVRRDYLRGILTGGRTDNTVPQAPPLKIRHLGEEGSEGAVAFQALFDKVDGCECRVFTENESWFDKFCRAAHAHGLGGVLNLVFHKKFTSDTARSVKSIGEHGEAFFVLLLGSGAGSTNFFDPDHQKTNWQVLKKLTDDGRSFCVVVYPFGRSIETWRKFGRRMIANWPTETHDKTYLLI